MSYLSRCAGVRLTSKELERAFEEIEIVEETLTKALRVLKENSAIPLVCNFYFSFSEFDMIPGYRIWQDRKRLLAHYPED